MQKLQTKPRPLSSEDDMVGLDFETYSEVDVRRIGSYAYARHPSTQVLILGYKLPHRPLRYWLPLWKLDVPLPADLAPFTSVGDWVPDDLAEYIENTDGLFGAHNAEFEMNIWDHIVTRVHGGPKIDRRRWRCTAAKAAAAGLPRALEKVAVALHLHHQKDPAGTRLINIFSKPRKPTKHDASTRTMPWDRPDEFYAFMWYCGKDVLVEREADTYIPDLPKSEWRAYQHTVLMNERGLPLDVQAVRNGYSMLRYFEQKVVARVEQLTGGIRPTQRDKMMAVMQGLGVELENLQAKTIRDLVLQRGADLAPEALEILQLRIEGGKASTKKLATMLLVVCDDGRVRGGFLFYGASTGRLSGKYIQPHNFIRGDYKPHQLERLFALIALGDPENIELLYEWPIDALAQGMRGYIYAPPGRKFVVVDYAAIEARVLAWYARERKVLDLYRAGEDLYKVFAVLVYKLKDISEVTTPQRKFAKDLYLGSGYQLGWKGFIENCLKRGIVVSEDEAKHAINTYRGNMPGVVKLWAEVEACAIEAVETCASVTNPVKLRNLAFFVDGIWFCIRLPSGRLLRYPYPKVEHVVRFRRPAKKLTYRSEIKGKWVREGTYGGKLVENIVQATARDIMVHGCHTAEAAGYGVIGTVHDELVTEVDEDFGSPQELERLVCVKPKWATDAPIAAEGWEGRRYRKG